MAWESRIKSYWTVCWKWIFPYPCKKTKTVYCCTGRWKQRCYLFFGEQWICCGTREYHYWTACFGIGTIDSSSETVCRNEIPSDSREGCPTLGGGQAPPSAGVGTSRSALVAANIGMGSMLGTILGIAISQFSEIVGQEPIAAIIGGAIVGFIFGAGTGKKCGCGMTLLALIIVIVLIWLVFYY